MNHGPFCPSACSSADSVNAQTHGCRGSATLGLCLRVHGTFTFHAGFCFTLIEKSPCRLRHVISPVSPLCIHTYTGIYVTQIGQASLRLFIFRVWLFWIVLWCVAAYSVPYSINSVLPTMSIRQPSTEQCIYKAIVPGLWAGFALCRACLVLKSTLRDAANLFGWTVSPILSFHHLVLRG